MQTREIPGWERVDAADAPACAQIVNGEWYFPVFGCDTLQMIVDDRDDLRYRLTESLAILRFVEWRGMDIYHNDRCPCCFQVEDKGHADDCKLAAILAKSQESQP